jgi:hypothetical protein
MEGATRRQVIALGLGVAAGLAGCLGGGRAGPGDGTDATDTQGSGGDAEVLSFNDADPFHRVEASFPQQDAADHYLALLSDDNHAAAFPTGRFRDEAAGDFLDKTDFSRAAVVVVHDRVSSSVPDLKLLNASVKDATVTVEAEYPGEAGTDDVTTDTMLVRVRTDGASVAAAEATIQPQYGDPVRLSTEDEDATETN